MQAGKYKRKMENKKRKKTLNIRNIPAGKDL